MRVINHIFLAAAAAALALVSCTKETTDNTENTQGQKSGVRTITVAFSKPDTRTSPTNVTGGIQPVWATGDQLTISDGSTTKTIDVPADAVGKTNFTFTTSLTGTIDVYYPGGNLFETYWNEGNAKISSNQTGEFATANLCKGTVAEDGTNLTLTNQTALFQVTPPSGVKQFTITSLKTIVDGQRTNGTAANIADNATVITVGDNSADLGTCYVALASGVNLSDLSFEYTTDDTYGAMKGIPMKDIPEGKDAVTAGSVYTITANNWHDYVKADGKKWATMNVGATETNPNGLYFAWGETTGHSFTGTPEYGYLENAFVSGFTTDDSKGFSWTNAPFNGGESSFSETEFNKVKNTVCPNGVLALAYDAANVNWGGAWRMPTNEDLTTFLNGTSSYTKGEDGSFTHQGVTFPAAGYGDGTVLGGAGVGGFYWSSSLDTVNPDFDYCLHFDFGVVRMDYGERYIGYSVRPLSE